MDYKITLIYLKSNYFGGGHENRIKIIQRFLELRRYKLNLIEISNFEQLKENLILINPKKNILILDISHPQIISKLNIEFVRNYFNKIVPIIIDGLNRKSNLGSFFEKNKCKVIIPYVCEKKNLSLNNENIIGIGESYFIFNEKLKNYFFSPRKRNSPQKYILLTFGQSDPQKLTLKILRKIKFLKLNEKGFYFLFSIGQLFEKNYKEKLLSFTNEKNIRCIGSNIFEYFNKIDCAISASGLTKYEMLLFEIPQLLIHIDENQKEASLPFEDKAGLKSYMKDEINNKNLENFVFNFDKIKINKKFVNNLINSYKKDISLNQINNTIKSIIEKNN